MPGRRAQRQRAIQISVETRLKEVAKSDEVDPETKLKAKKAVKEMAREKEKEERRKRELKNRLAAARMTTTTTTTTTVTTVTRLAAPLQGTHGGRWKLG